MSPALVTLLGLAAITYLLKAAGPLVLGGRKMPPAVTHFTRLVPGPLLAALALTSTIVDSGRFVFDARLAGLAAAAIALRFKAGFVVVVLVAAATTALVRSLG